MTLWIVLASLAAYLIVGYGFVAPRYVRDEVEKIVRKHPGLATGPGQIAEWRRFAAGSAVGVALIWPFWLVGYALVRWIERSTPRTDFELRELAKEQAARLTQLERELGINQTGRSR